MANFPLTRTDVRGIMAVDCLEKHGGNSMDKDCTKLCELLKNKKGDSQAALKVTIKAILDSLDPTQFEQAIAFCVPDLPYQKDK